MAALGNAKKNWIFMHCLPRKPYEVSDEVEFYIIFHTYDLLCRSFTILRDLSFSKKQKIESML